MPNGADWKKRAKRAPPASGSNSAALSSARLSTASVRPFPLGMARAKRRAGTMRPSSRRSSTSRLATCVAARSSRLATRPPPSPDVMSASVRRCSSTERELRPSQRASVALACSSEPSPLTEARPTGAESNWASCTSTFASRAASCIRSTVTSAMRHTTSESETPSPSVSKGCTETLSFLPPRWPGPALRRANSSMSVSPRSAARVSRNNAALAGGSPVNSSCRVATPASSLRPTIVAKAALA